MTDKSRVRGGYQPPGGGSKPSAPATGSGVFRYTEKTDEIARLRSILKRCRTVLRNMARENEGAIFFRWPIHHEPLRSDAKNLLPEIDRCLDEVVVGASE